MLIILFFFSDSVFLWTCFLCRNFCVRRDFVSNPKTLKKRLMIVGIAMLLLSPFLVIFMLVYLFLRHAEQFYNHPSTASSRRWSNLSRWVFREHNEVPLLSFCPFLQLIYLHCKGLMLVCVLSERNHYTTINI